MRIIISLICQNYISGGGGVYKLFQLLRIRKSKTVVINGKDCAIYFAPQWHALSNDCVKYILKTVDENKGLSKYFKRSYAPDELLIPTIVFNSPFRNNTLARDFPKNTHYNFKTSIHFLNYEPVIEVFDEKRASEVLSSDKLFIRKVRSGVSDSLIGIIDNFRDKE